MIPPVLTLQNGFLANPIDDRVRTTQQPYAVADMVLYRSRLAYTVTLYNAQNLQGYGNIVSGWVHLQGCSNIMLSMGVNVLASVACYS